MGTPSSKLTDKLRRDPGALLQSTRHYYAQQSENEIKLAIPVVLRGSIESHLLTSALCGLGSAFAVYLITGMNGTLVAGVVTTLVFIISAASKMTLGILAVTEYEYILIRLNGRAVEGGTIEGVAQRPAKLPKTHQFKSMIRSNQPLPFCKTEKEGWYYCAINGKFLDVIRQLVEADSIRARASVANQPFEESVIV